MSRKGGFPDRQKFFTSANSMNMFSLPQFLRFDVQYRTRENVFVFGGIALLICALNLPLTQSTLGSTVSLVGYGSQYAWLCVIATVILYVLHFRASSPVAKLMLQVVSWAGIALVCESAYVHYQWRDWHLMWAAAFGYPSATDQAAFVQYLVNEFNVGVEVLKFASDLGRDFTRFTDQLNMDQRRELLSVAGIHYHVLPTGFCCLVAGVLLILSATRKRIGKLAASR